MWSLTRHWFALRIVFIIFVGWWLYEAAQRWRDDLETLQNRESVLETRLVIGYWILNAVLLGLAIWAAVSVWHSRFFRIW